MAALSTALSTLGFRLTAEILPPWHGSRAYGTVPGRSKV
jgi:hypothetical protein